jgi:hypothetical protein
VSEFPGPAQWIVERLDFDYLTGRHEGFGSLRWSPDGGFSLEAQLTRRPPSPSGGVGIGHVGLVPKRDLRTVRMRLPGGVRAVSLPIPLLDRLDVLMQGKLSLQFPCACFFESTSTERRRKRWFGSASLRTDSRLKLPLTIETRTRVGKRTVERSSCWGAFDLEEKNGLRLSGRMVSDKRLALEWSLPRSRENRSRLWRVPEAVRNALAALYGQDVGLAWRQIERNGHQISEYRLCHDVRTLGVFGPFYDLQVSEALLLRLVLFFLDQPEYAWVCVHMLQQMLDAFRQTTSAATELLVGTILEATLRSWEGKPFKPGGHYSVPAGLGHFRSAYLDKSWLPHCERALTAFRRVRNRNAHPDWLTQRGGQLSTTEARRTTADLLFLSRFYGYMMLALAGVSIQQPRFPAEAP